MRALTDWVGRLAGYLAWRLIDRIDETNYCCPNCAVYDSEETD